MHHATARQRLAALRRKIETFASTPRWVKQARARRLARLEAAISTALPFDPSLAPEAEGRHAPGAGSPERDNLS